MNILFLFHISPFFSFRITAHHYVDSFVFILNIFLIAFLFLFFSISFCVIFSNLCSMFLNTFSLLFILYFVPIIVFVFSFNYYPLSSASLFFFFWLSLQFSCFLLSIFHIFLITKSAHSVCLFYGLCFEVSHFLC